MDGYILIHRKLSEWQWYRDSNTKSLFIDLLLDANWQESKSGFLTIQRGQVLTSLKRMSLRTGLSFREIRTSLSKLEKSGEIDKQTTNKYSIITINKYNDYQDIDKQTTSKRQTNDNIKEYKEEKEYKEIKEKYIKRKYGTFENVLLTDDEYEKLKDRFNDYEEKIERLSSYIASKGAKYKSHYATILNWARQDDKEIPGWFNKSTTKKKLTEKEMLELNELFKES